MLTLIFDEAATKFGHDYHPERPARLIKLRGLPSGQAPGLDLDETEARHRTGSFASPSPKTP